MEHVLVKMAELQSTLNKTGWTVLYPKTRRTAEMKAALLWVAERDGIQVRAATKQELVRRCWRMEDIDELKQEMLTQN